MTTALAGSVLARGRSIAYLVLLVSCTMCQRKEVAPTPNASFAFQGTADSVLTLGTSDTWTVTSLAQTPQTVYWDLGNGTHASSSQVTISYPTAGTYTLTLTATNQAGETRTEQKTVRVLNRVLKRIIFNRVYWSPTPSSIPNFNATWPLTTTADVYAQVQEVTPTTTFAPGGLVPSATVLFQSAVLPGVSYNTQTPLTLTVASRFVFDKQKYKEGGYLLSLLARNAEATYCLTSNMFSGSSTVINKEDIARNEFSVTTSLMSSVTFECEYE